MITCFLYLRPPVLLFAITWWFVFTFPSFGIDFFGDFCSTGPKLFWLLIREHFNSKIIAHYGWRPPHWMRVDFLHIVETVKRLQASTWLLHVRHGNDKDNGGDHYDDNISTYIIKHVPSSSDSCSWKQTWFSFSISTPNPTSSLCPLLHYCEAAPSGENLC